ncbi:MULTISPECIES: mandelate racemase/muconate lactonizing enzyme family protein [unclassified Mesorhizobium]|uniref:mandelate racemase/muconate lactonizing enzyme family protein n=3 Tax=Mesorhizobium TaxID=68287 RepID=UPI000BAF31F4|nr:MULTISPECIES: mandelate racemase/muconate lactonizing enzyme family protein [unclassified Mesorhizobium]MDG4888189.1 mandelate racemase/muconate lactonizing enzyme family protein [Mesorhizobium sp. WSM4887]PBB35175.1 mandelate racemase [Mesorhizobium sp. WSM3882]RUV06168.1 mandelate racemase [Mesorhizobium sp. M1A.F.Ca.IN.020.03.2.1]RUV81954.1 mandelate racemase [Mesorhizobium sp. M1A.F.Ca.IN.020.32.1.1]RUW09715.1 mandelate racemase [Mesorhizobium sp. M1A.F.Ca.IN.022.05.2.1]
MKIKSIKAYHVVQPFVDGPYRMSKGRVADCFDAVIVAITSDTGVTGWGEMAPLGNFYSAAFPAGTRAGVPEIAPHLIGHDPRGLAGIVRLMDTVFKGHPYVKAALDMACWDLAARAADVPLVAMLGGRESETAELYRVVTHGTVDQMAALAKRIVAEGYHRLQVKVGGNVGDDIERVSAVASAVPKGTVIFCDANAGWTPYQARQFADATRGIDYTFEQPCTTIEENMSVRRMLDKPMVLDESVTSLGEMLEIHRRGAADGLTLKISRLGGVTQTRLIRDVAVELGFMVTIEDTGGAEIDTAAMAHLSLSTPEERRLHAIAFHEWVTVRTASNKPPVAGSRMGIPDGPGLGINVVPDLLGKPFFEIG